MPEILQTMIQVLRDCMDWLVTAVKYIWSLIPIHGKNMDLVHILTQIPGGGCRARALENYLHAKTDDFYCYYLLEKFSDPKTVQLLSDTTKRESLLEMASKILLHDQDTKGIPAEILHRSMAKSLEKIYSYEYMKTLIKGFTNIECTFENSNHKHMLHIIFNNLMHGEQLSGDVSSQWSSIGFQGKNPCTDFRRCGALALYGLFYWSTKYCKQSKYIIKKLSKPDPTRVLPFALLSIHSVDMAFTLVITNKARNRFLNLVRYIPATHEFDELDPQKKDRDDLFELNLWEAQLVEEFFDFSYEIFRGISQIWIKKERTVLEYNLIRNEFLKEFEKKLRDPYFFC